MASEKADIVTSAVLAPFRHGEAFLFHEDGLEVTRTTDFNEWADMGHILSVMHRGGAWVTGDWLNYGEDLFGERASQCVDARYFADETLKVYRWVAKQIPRERRFHTLSFKHHQLVAALKPDRQQYWLGRAAANGWSAGDMRKEMRDSGEPGAVAYWLVVKCTDQQDLEGLKSSLESKGRVCEARTAKVRAAGEPTKRLTARGSKGKKGKRSTERENR